ncbi:copper amine oxidase N-terminal domain-containing protein [Paenibacillus agilis]|uniref:Copper amine oxidase N-terminal domain-containing protein n=1 Tax=Paenibacillus agilis TaxID=3020863 RepID=A0A559IDK6_9BACL|nr:copper amine oxidase N-terminal domain-containing protein [Paenibacillus agilis]TVX85610.1 copper amine oxidase N-terminal domain-containing protein [Paenibacillus agilis]
MKKTMLCVLASSIIAGSILGGVNYSYAAAPTDNKVQIIKDGKKIHLGDSKPFQDKQGSVMVPIRFVSEALGAKVGFQKSKGSMKVNVADEKNTVEMTVGQTTAKVNGKNRNYGTQVVLKGNRTYVPLRLVGEGLGQNVEWDKINRWVWIGKKDVKALDEIGIKPVDIAPYKKFFSGKPVMMKKVGLKDDYTKAVIFERSQLPLTFIDDFYSLDYVKEKDGNFYIKARTKTRTSTPGDIFFLTKDNKPKLRNPVFKKTIDHGDGTKTFFYPVVSWLDELDGDNKYKSLTIKDVLYIGFMHGGDDYIPLMKNSWK